MTPKDIERGRYTLLRVLGEGSQGETYEARDNGVASERPSPDRLVDDWEEYVRRARAGETPNARGLVAIKCFRVTKAKAWKDVELAEREARTLASLDHPNLPKYLNHFEEDGALYLVMEKIDGESLASLRARGATMSDAEVTRMLEDIGGALGYLHGRSPPIVHRDIKPANVIRRPDGSFVLVDFGSVRDRLKPAGGSTVVGTFGYMAPEQFQGRALPESDLYGLGATALTMLTGVEPEDQPHEGLAIDVDRALPRTTPEGLVRALASMLVPDPDRRAASIEAAMYGHGASHTIVLETDGQWFVGFTGAGVKTAAAPADACHFGAGDTKELERTIARLKERGRSVQKRLVWARPHERPPSVRPPPPQRKEERHDERHARRQRRRELRDERRRRRAETRARRVPLLPRLVANLALLVASIAVWIAVGVVTPLVLGLLSLSFGPKLRRAARACFAAAVRSQRAMGAASARLSGHEPPEEARVRVSDESVYDRRVRVGDHEEEHAEDEEHAHEEPRRRRHDRGPAR